MANILDGRKLSALMEKHLLSVIKSDFIKAGREPGLAVIRVGEDPASGVYVSNKKKACARVGIKSFESQLSANTSEKEVINEIESFNLNKEVDAILVQLPLPEGLSENNILKSILPSKDADGLHTSNLGKLLKGEPGPRSCTPAGVMALLEQNNIKIEGKRAVVVGRSILVGKPMAIMLQEANATVTVAHSKTQNLAQLTKQADLLIVAAGRPRMIDSDYIKPGAVVIDVGIHRILDETQRENGSSMKLCGDVLFEDVSQHVSAITPVPGGVGPMTVTMLLVNTVFAWSTHFDLSKSFNDLLPTFTND
tara:strand:- start:106 stop:1029 length:924 start_codon:yes stop_codon:yes gene_type:complete